MVLYSVVFVSSYLNYLNVIWEILDIFYKMFCEKFEMNYVEFLYLCKG